MSQGDWWLLPSFAGEDAGLRAERPLVQGRLEPKSSQDRLGFAAVTPPVDPDNKGLVHAHVTKPSGLTGALLLVILTLGPRLSKQPPSDTSLVPMAEGRPSEGAQNGEEVLGLEIAHLFSAHNSLARLVS